MISSAVTPSRVVASVKLPIETINIKLTKKYGDSEYWALQCQVSGEQEYVNKRGEKYTVKAKDMELAYFSVFKGKAYLRTHMPAQKLVVSSSDGQVIPELGSWERLFDYFNNLAAAAANSPLLKLKPHFLSFVLEIPMERLHKKVVSYLYSNFTVLKYEGDDQKCFTIATFSEKKDKSSPPTSKTLPVQIFMVYDSQSNLVERCDSWIDLVDFVPTK